MMTWWIEVIVVIFLIISNRSLSRRLGNLESKLKNLGGAGEKKIEPVNSAVISNPETILKDASAYSAQNQEKLKEWFDPKAPREKDAGERFGEWLKEDWLMKLGAFLFIVGFGWFVSYAFANNWIGPVGRISIGILAGIIIMTLGFWRMTKYKTQGAVFMALGAGMAMLTIFAGRSIYGFFTPASAVAFDFIIVAFVSFASYKFNIKSLAFIAQILAFVAPLLTSGSTESIFLFSYLLFISLATLFLASITGWRDLIVSSLIFVGLYSLPYIGAGSFNSSMYGRDASIILNFAYIFGVMYLLAGMISVVKKGVENINNEIILAVLNGLFLFLWIFNVAGKEWHSMLFAFWAVIFTICSFAAFKLSSQLAPFYAYGAVAVAFIAAATAAQLSGTTLTIAFTMEVLLLVLCILLLTKNTKAASSVSWLFIVPLILSFSSISGYSGSQELFTKDFFVLVLIAAALVIAGRLIVWNSLSQNEKKEEANAGSVLVVLGILYLMYVVWQFIHILMIGAQDMATMTTLLVYTVFGLISYFSGLYSGDMARRTYGVALLAFVVVRLIIVDVWQMALFGRVVTFLAIGVLLMSTAFLTKKKKEEIDSRIIIK